MNAGHINHLLNIQFQHYDYRLNNVFIFAWESDFLCQSGSGYWVEVEVKISRADFFRDFDKPKHRLFQKVRQAVTHYVEDYGKTDGDFICRYRWAEMIDGSGYAYNDLKNPGRRWDPWMKLT